MMADVTINCKRTLPYVFCGVFIWREPPFWLTTVLHTSEKTQSVAKLAMRDSSRGLVT